MASLADSPSTAPAGRPAAAPARRRVLVFRLPGHACALPLASVAEVVPMALLSRPPGLPAVLEGFLDMGGAALPVRPDRLLGLPALTPGLYTPLLVLRHPEDRLALLVEAVEGIAAVDPADLRPLAPGHSFNDCVEAGWTAAGRTVHLLDPERLLLEKERQCLAELQAAEEGRLHRLAAPPEEGTP